jgi:hypothetical protein
LIPIVIGRNSIFVILPGKQFVVVILIPNPTSTGIEELKTVSDKLVNYTGRHLDITLE